MKGFGLRTGMVVFFVGMVLVGGTGQGFAQGMSLRVGGTSAPPSLVELPIFVARDKGFYKEEGLEVTMLMFAGDPIAQRALIAGEIDIVDNNLSQTITAVSKGAAIKAISAHVTKLTYLFIAQKEIGSVKDLAGKTIAVSAPGALSYHVPRMVMQKYGVNPDSAKYLPVGSDTARFQALIAKKADATILHVVRAIQSQSEPTLHSIADIGQELPDLVQFYLATTDKVIKEKPEALKRFVRAQIKATRWILKNPEEAARIAMTIIPNVPEDVMRKGIDLVIKSNAWDPDAYMDPKAVAATHQLLLDTKVIDRPVATELYLEPRFVAEALKELGKVR